MFRPAFADLPIRLLQRVFQVGDPGVQSLFTGGEVANRSDQIIDIFQVVADKAGHLGLGLENARVRVDEQRASQQVGTIFGGGLGGDDIVDRDGI